MTGTADDIDTPLIAWATERFGGRRREASRTGGHRPALRPGDRRMPDRLRRTLRRHPPALPGPAQHAAAQGGAGDDLRPGQGREPRQPLQPLAGPVALGSELRRATTPCSLAIRRWPSASAADTAAAVAKADEALARLDGIRDQLEPGAYQFLRFRLEENRHHLVLFGHAAQAWLACLRLPRRRQRPRR